jgi:hypothetical protein
MKLGSEAIIRHLDDWCITEAERGHSKSSTSRNPFPLVVRYVEKPRLPSALSAAYPPEHPPYTEEAGDQGTQEDHDSEGYVDHALATLPGQLVAKRAVPLG